MSSLLENFKVCTRCDEAKRRAEFGPHPLASDGLQSWCRECRAEYIRDERAKGRFDTTKQRAAYHQAGVRLREAHRDEFDRYYAEELEA